jgi:hypothetical protein
MKPIRFTTHAEEKFAALAEHGCNLTKDQVIATLTFPQVVTVGYKNRIVAQSPLDSRHVLRVVYEERDNEVVVVTFYPGRRSYYESPIQP